MDCNEARPLLDASVDGELSSSEARGVEQHLASCDACRRERDAIHAVSRTTREAAMYYRAPDALRARIVAALPPSIAPAVEAAPARPARSADSPAPKPRRTPRFAWLTGWLRPPLGTPGGGLFGAATSLGALSMFAVGIVALALGAAVALHRPSATDTLADELVASHVRAQISGRDIDVVSTDRHTVKPWFNGRLDYAPPVEDLAASGFTLTGGRLDYVEHRRVAVLVYRYGKHVIDVYVLPDQGTAAAQPTSTLVKDGYALARWHDAGMVWCAVTDAEPNVLANFRTALNARLHGAHDPAPAREG